MKTIIICILTTLLLFVACTTKDEQQKYAPSEGEQLANHILAHTAIIIKDQYNLVPCGEGVSMPGGPIQKLALCFNTKYPHTKEQLRKLIIKTAQELLNQVNTNQEIQKFIKAPPFSIKNVQIIIYNHDRNGRSLRDPEISNAQILQGVLNYSTIDPDDSFKYKNEYEETYEEALKALSNP